MMSSMATLLARRRLEADGVQRQGDRCGSREVERQYKPDFAHNRGGRRRVIDERSMVRQRMTNETKSRFHRRPTWLQAP